MERDTGIWDTGSEDGTGVQKPTSLHLRHSNNKMIDKITAAVVNVSMNNGDACQVDPKKEIEKGPTCSSTQNCNGGNSITADVSRDVEEQTCAVFGQIIDNDDETWQVLSNAASWESSFPKEILSEAATTSEATNYSQSDYEDLPSGWKKVSDSAGYYYWNVETGQTQSSPPTEETDGAVTTSEDASLQRLLSPEEPKKVGERTSNSRDGHMFLVRSLGWLPMETENLKPDISSAAVNSCIRLLSNNRSQIMDGVGVWGEGKDLMLLINDDQLKIVDPLEDTVLQTQLIKHIRLWGVGRDSSHDFAYVVRDPSTKVYKCHVFRCDAPAQAIAKQLHAVCSYLVQQKKRNNQIGIESVSTDIIPIATAEPRQIFSAKYVGCMKVSKPSGIDIIRQSISRLTEGTNGLENAKDVNVSISASALTIDQEGSTPLVNCRMRCLSFMGVGNDIQLFGFISVIAGEATCHVLQCTPNAAKLAVAVQEACMLRYQKAIDSKQPVTSPETPVRNKSFKNKLVKLFSGLRRSGS